jgi:hypothetical protein
MYYENLFMYITEDYFLFEPITLKPASECMAIDRKLNESFMISKSAISYMTTNQTETKNVFGIVGSIRLISGNKQFSFKDSGVLCHLCAI